MTLAAGSRLGPYEVLGSLGHGGMGEVYRALDSNLKRQVALKVLPADVSSDTERLARFQREAEVLAALNHPHIAQIYGLERTGAITALVMELVEGSTLADRIARGPMAVEEALPIARQIAEALEAAHEQGIIHRDLKPANIKVRDDGTVKVLDFGLAKAIEPSAAAGSNLTLSPTITTPAVTRAGIILGTAAYMSPEQAKGRPADRRSDVWAFGCVLYEMLAGHRAFDGDDMTEVLGAVVRLEPDWQALPADLPPPVRTLLHRCLVKDRRARVGDIAAARFVLEHQAGSEAPGTVPAAATRRRSWWPVAAAAGALAMAVLSGGLVRWVSRPPPASVVRTTIPTDGAAPLTLSGNWRDIAISPDGSRVVWVSGNRIVVRSLGDLEARVLTGLGAPRSIFLSPDGQWIGFFDGQTIKKVPIAGGAPLVVSTVQGDAAGATWGPDGTIVFATADRTTGLQRVSADGGTPTVLTRPSFERGEREHVWPEFLPDGSAVLFTVWGATSAANTGRVGVFDLQTGEQKILPGIGTHARYVSTGHLLYGVAGALHAVAFDRDRLQTTGTPVPVLQGVAISGIGAVNAALAANGSLVYVQGSAGGPQDLLLVNRDGTPSPLKNLEPGPYREVRISPDGSRMALSIGRDLWIYEFSRGLLFQVTRDPTRASHPLWSPDGQRLVFTSARSGFPELFWRAADGTGADEPLTGRSKDLTDLIANDWSDDGKTLLFTEVPPDLRYVLGQVTIGSPSDAKVILSDALMAAVSPDGRSIAYQSTPAPHSEIFIERFPELGNRQPVSTGGGNRPVWSSDGRTLFFSSPDGRRLYAAAVQHGPPLIVDTPQVVFEGAMLGPQFGVQPFDVLPDGRLVVIVRGDSEAVGSATSLVLVQNWDQELKRLVPVD